MLKQIIKIFIPEALLKKYRAQKLKKSQFDNKPVKEVFTEIYTKNHWSSAESVSGPGSEYEQTKNLIKDLEALISELKVTSMLDIPCGDFNWMKRVDLATVNYTGADIVEPLIAKNNELYKSDMQKFVVLNLIQDNLPQNDLIFVRDCLVHLSNDDILKALANIKKSGGKYLLTTTFFNQTENYDIATGNWRTINLEKPPFNLPKPIRYIIEDCSEFNGAFKDKSMGLWEIEKI